MGGVPSIGKFLHKDFTCVLKGGAICEKNPGAGIFFQKKKEKSRVPGFTGQFFGRYAPDQNTDLRPNGGGADGVLEGEGKFAVGQI